MTRTLAFSATGWDDYQFWQTQDRKTLKRVNQLLREILRDPFNGIGKPEALRENLAGYWSRRIDEKNRIVYTVRDGTIVIISCRLHYE